jgi:hypothetical protein
MQPTFRTHCLVLTTVPQSETQHLPSEQTPHLLKLKTMDFPGALEAGRCNGGTNQQLLTVKHHTVACG